MSSIGDRYTVVDVDAHYADNFEDLVDYFDDDDPWKRRFEHGSQLERSESVLKFWPKLTGSASIPLPRFQEGDHHTVRTDEHLHTKEQVTRAMDDLGIAKILLLSNQMLVYGMMEDDKRQVKFANAYTDYMLDNLVDPSQGIYMAVPAPFNTPHEAADLIDRVKGEAGVVGVCLVCSQVEPPLGHHMYDPMYEVVNDAELPIVYHGGAATVDNFYMSGFTSSVETRTLGFLWDNTAALASVVAQGLPEKFPNLDFVFLESGIFYVPTLMYRMDMEFLRREWELPLLNKRPSKYMKEFYYGTQPLEVPPTNDYFEDIIEMIGGPDRLMYASDYPHEDYDDPHVITEMSFLSDDEKAQILGRTAERVFGI